jgi:hypothetical protein
MLVLSTIFINILKCCNIFLEMLDNNFFSTFGIAAAGRTACVPQRQRA